MSCTYSKCRAHIQNVVHIFKMSCTYSKCRAHIQNVVHIFKITDIALVGWYERRRGQSQRNCQAQYGKCTGRTTKKEVCIIHLAGVKHV